MENIKIYPVDYRISFLFNNPFPFPEEELIENLSKKGFSEIKDIPKIMGAPPLQIVRASIAKKGNNEVIYNPDKGHVGVGGENFKEVNDDFNILESTLRDDLEIDFSIIKSIELISANRVYTKNDPLETISKFCDSKNLSKFKEIFNEDVKPLSVRMYTKTEIVGGLNIIPNWVDLTIEPFIPNPKYYFVRLIYRNTDKDKVKGISKEIERVILRSIELMEET